MKRLAIFLPSLDGGGAEKMMLALAERFVARGVQCDLVIAISKGQFLDKVPTGVRLVELSKKKTIHAVFALTKYLHRESPDTLLATIFAANICALIASAMAPRKLRTVICEANLSQIDLRSKSLLRTALNYMITLPLYHKAASVIAISNGVQQSLLDNHLAKASRIRLIYNPACLATHHPEAPRKRSNNLLVACGRLEPQKDYPTLLRAFARIRKTSNTKLWILGEGTLRQQLETECKKLGLEDFVSFKGFAHNPERYMCEATVFVHSALFEGFGLVLVEALSSGCPVVATDCPGGVREVLAGGKYGTLVPVGDDAALADAILRILRGEVTFPDASEHLRQFDIDHVADAYLATLFPDACLKPHQPSAI